MNLTFLLFCSTTIRAAGTAPEADIRAELSRQIPECDSVAENAARMLRKPEANKLKIEAEWQALCPNSQPLRFYRLAGKLESLNENSAELNEELWVQLKMRPRYSKAAQRSQINTLLSEMASRATPTSEDGKLLQTYFTAGYYGFRTEVAAAKKGRLHSFYRRDLDTAERGLSVSLTFTTGAWLPTGNLSRLGNHPSLGFNFLVGYDSFYVGLMFDFRFLSTPETYTFFNPNTGSLERTNTFFGLFLGPDFRWEFFRDDRFSGFALAGLGYDMITHHAAQRYSRERPAYSDTFNLNGGLGFRYYLTNAKTLYLDLETRYHHVNYKGSGNGEDDLGGKAFTAMLVIGYRIAFDE